MCPEQAGRSCGQRHRLRGEPAARDQRVVHDRDGELDAVRLAGVATHLILKQKTDYNFIDENDLDHR